MSRRDTRVLVNVGEPAENLIGAFQVFVLAGLAYLIYDYAGKPMAERWISDPRELEGAAKDNYAVYPVTASFIGATFLFSVYLGPMMQRFVRRGFNQCEMRQAAYQILNSSSGDTALALQVTRGKGLFINDPGKLKVHGRQFSYPSFNWGNIVRIGLPRVVLNLAFIATIAALPWVLIALDDGIRNENMNDDDDNPEAAQKAAEAAAFEWGEVAFFAVIGVQLCVCLMAIIVNNQVYVPVKDMYRQDKLRSPDVDGSGGPSDIFPGRCATVDGWLTRSLFEDNHRRFEVQQFDDDNPIASIGASEAHDGDRFIQTSGDTVGDSTDTLSAQRTTPPPLPVSPPPSHGPQTDPVVSAAEGSGGGDKDRKQQYEEILAMADELGVAQWGDKPVGEQVLRDDQRSDPVFNQTVDGIAPSEDPADGNPDPAGSSLADAIRSSDVFKRKNPDQSNQSGAGLVPTAGGPGSA